MKDLDSIRKEINETDEELLRLFINRMELSKQVAEYKSENHIPIVNKTREREILAKAVNDSGDLGTYAHRFFSNLMELSKAYQGELIPAVSTLTHTINNAIQAPGITLPKTAVVACQGCEGAYSQAATDKMFPCATIMYMKTFQAVFDAVEDGLCEYGVVPIENSVGGSVSATYNLLEKRNVYILKSEKICVHHVLLAKPGTKFNDIKEIHSHEQALTQCSKFLKSLGDDVKSISEANTALAAKYVAESSGNSTASISSHDCAEIYDLKILDNDIQDSDNNYTRFICISKKPQIFSGANRISLILTTAHRPGALNEILAKFASLGINMLKLESCPIPGEDFEFIFHFDIEASVLDQGVLTMLAELERSCSTFKFLGNYSEN